jgi:hypothetical protein
LDPKDPNWMVVAAGTATSPPQLYYSHDAGKHWKASSGLSTRVQRNATIYFPTHRLYAAFNPNWQKTIVVADHDPSTDNLEFYVSANGGASFLHVSTLAQPKSQRPWPHVILPEAEKGNGYYYATRFYGNRIAFNPNAKPKTKPALVATTRFGAFISYDVGSTWQRIDTTAIAHHFVGLAWNGGYVYLASFGEGVLKSTKPLQ